MMRHGIMRLALALLSLPALARGQASRTEPAAFADLRSDGNGVAALRTTISAGFAGARASDAFERVAEEAQLDITFDPQLPQLQTTLTIAAHPRSAAAALLEIARESRVRVRVSRDGQLIVAALTVVALKPSVRDTTPRDTVPPTLPTVHTSADRIERQEFAIGSGPGRVSLTGQEARSAPVFVEPDLLRSVQTLPGIESRSDYSAGFNVRGGEGDQNLILIDGYPVFSPFHMFGLFSTFIDPAVSRVDVYRGALPTRFDGRLSSVLSVQSANATSSALHGTAEVSLVSSNASVGRTFDHGDGSWMIAARRTYADAMVNLFKPGAFPYHFGDVQGHLETPIGSGLRLSATAYDGADVMARADDDPSFFGGVWGNRVVGATLSKTIAGGVHRLLGADSIALVQRASTTRYDIRADIPTVLFHAANHVTDVRTSGAMTLYSARWTHEIGYELSSDRTSYYANAPSTEFGDLIPFDSLTQRSRVASAYADALWRPTSSAIVDGGVRADALDGARGSIILPRLSLKYFLTPDVALVAATGRYAQWLQSLGREEELVQPFQFWVSSASAPSVSHDIVAGLERWITPRRLFHIEAFDKRYERLLIPNAAHALDVTGDEFVPVRGTSYGAEVLLRQLDGGAFSGWVAYTYAVSTRVTADGVRSFPTQDQRHNLNLVGSWRAGVYTLGARVHVASGAPYTPVVGAFGRLVYDPIRKRWMPDPADPSTQNIPGEANSARVPFYDRIDMSVRRNGHIGAASFAPYLSIVNLLNAKNPAGYIYDFRGKPHRTSFPNLPFAPTFGATIAY